MTWLPLKIFAIELAFAVAVIWLERWRAERALWADLDTPGLPETTVTLGPPDVDVEQFVDIEGALEDLEGIDRLLAEGEIAEARRQVRRVIEVLEGRDEAALADQRWHAQRAAA